ncbi:MAG: hypothetical protein ACJAZ1_001490, partial [Yoonia sp.]
MARGALIVPATMPKERIMKRVDIVKWT